MARAARSAAAVKQRPQPRYLLDSSVLIEAYQRNHPPDVNESFWERLSSLVSNGLARMPDEIYREIERKADGLLDWCKERKDDLVMPIEEAEQRAVAEVLAAHRRLVDTKKGRSMGDPWVIAFAKVHGASVVTEEDATGNIVTPKIPDVCKAMGIPCMNTLSLIRAERWKF
jgi:predicted nucleic acid-binding protein